MHPHVPASRLHGLPDGYKLRASGFRLVYQVHDKVLVVTVIAVGKREKRLVYLAAKKRL
jgi:mRNA interferase RelE/StbE